MKKLFLLSTLFLLCHSLVWCQDFKVPINYTLESKDDFIKYEKEVLAGINYIENTPRNKISNAKEINTFLIAWMAGTPTVSIELRQEIMPNADVPELLIAFMSGWTKFAIENPSQKSDVIKCNLAGLNSVIKVYTLNKMKPIKEIDQLIKMQEKGTLEKWVGDQLKK